jgi:hypothetical protein
LKALFPYAAQIVPRFARDLIFAQRVEFWFFGRNVDVSHFSALFTRNVCNMFSLRQRIAFNNVLGFFLGRATPAAHEIVSHRYKVSHVVPSLSVANVGAVAHFVDRVNHRAPIAYVVGVFQNVAKRVKRLARPLLAATAYRAKAGCGFKAHLFMGGLKIHNLFFRWLVGVLCKYDIPVKSASDTCKIKRLT